MEDELVFKCDTCHEVFDPDPDSMITVEIASYTIPNSPEYTVEDFLNISSGKRASYGISTAVYAPAELSNVAACICSKCRIKYKYKDANN